MLAIRTNCENCNKELPIDSIEAMICTFECTFCKDCVDNLFHNVCPNCGGGFTTRPIRPKKYLDKYAIGKNTIYKPADMEKFKKLLNRYKNIPPKDR